MVARAARPVAARAGGRGRDLAAPPELPRIRARRAEPRDGAAPVRRARRAAAPAERAAARGRLRAGVARERSQPTPSLAQVNGALDHMLAQQEPYPAFVVDRRWNLLRANSRGREPRGVPARGSADRRGQSRRRARRARRAAALHRKLGRRRGALPAQRAGRRASPTARRRPPSCCGVCSPIRACRRSRASRRSKRIRRCCTFISARATRGSRCSPPSRRSARRRT